MFWTTLTPWESEEEIQRGGNESGRGTSKRGASPRREHQRRRESQERERRDLLRGVKDAIRVSEDREQQEEQPSLVQPLLLPQEQEEHQQLQHQQQQPSLPPLTLSRPTQQGPTSIFQQQQPQQQLQQEQQQQPLLLQHSAPQPLTSQRVWGEPLAQPQPQPQPQVRASSLRHPQAMMPNRQPRSSFRDRMTTDAPTDGDFFVRQLCACLLVTVVLIVSLSYYAHLHPEVFEGIRVVVSVFSFVAKLYISLYPPPVLIIAMVSSWCFSTTWKEYTFLLSTFPIQVIGYLVWGVRSLLGKSQG